MCCKYRRVGCLVYFECVRIRKPKYSIIGACGEVEAHMKGEVQADMKGVPGGEEQGHMKCIAPYTLVWSTTGTYTLVSTIGTYTLVSSTTLYQCGQYGYKLV